LREIRKISRFKNLRKKSENRNSFSGIEREVLSFMRKEYRPVETMVSFTLLLTP
jgi:hypothetical protein